MTTVEENTAVEAADLDAEESQTPEEAAADEGLTDLQKKGKKRPSAVQRALAEWVIQHTGYNPDDDDESKMDVFLKGIQLGRTCAVDFQKAPERQEAKFAAKHERAQRQIKNIQEREAKETARLEAEAKRREERAAKRRENLEKAKAMLAEVEAQKEQAVAAVQTSEDVTVTEVEPAQTENTNESNTEAEQAVRPRRGRGRPRKTSGNEEF